MLYTRPESLRIELDFITDSIDVFPLVIIFLTLRNLSFVNVISSGSTRLLPRIRMNRNPRQILYKILRKKVMEMLVNTTVNSSYPCVFVKSI